MTTCNALVYENGLKTAKRCSKPPGHKSPHALEVADHIQMMRTRAARLSAFATSAVTAYESALAEAEALGIQHPVIEELRAVILNGRRILAKSAELSKRIP